MEAETTPSKASAWTYAELFVYDGNRVLKPTHVCADEITFRDAPRLLSEEIRVCVKNGDRQTTRAARVLPHESHATRIPIQLIQTEQQAPAKLTA
jgi:hypothetical protein